MKNILFGFIRVELIFACQEVAKCLWPSMIRNKFLFIQIQRIPLGMQYKCKEIIDIARKPTKRNHKGPNPL